MNAVVGALRVVLGIDTAAFEKGATLAQKHLVQTGKKFEAIGASIANVGSKMTLGLTAPLSALAVQSSKAATESAQAMGQVNAALASMGDASGRTSEQLAKSAEGLMKISTYDDDEILRKVTANMLTFGKVAGENFDRAQLAAVNLATRLGGDLQGATMMIGKALNDPVKGLAAMSKAGIQFTADQKEMIKGMVASGDAAGAQAIILAELEKQFGGSAAAMRAATPGIDSKQAWDSFNEVVGKIVNEALPPLTALLTRVLESFNNLSPGMQTFAVGAAAAGAALGPILMVVGPMVSSMGKLAPLFATAGGGAAAGATGLAALGTALLPLTAAALAGYAAWKNWDTIGPILSKWASGVKENFAKADADLKAFSTSIAGIDKKLGMPPPSAYANAVKAQAGKMMEDFRRLNADLGKVGEWARQTDAKIAAFATNAAASVQRLYVGVKTWMLDRLSAVWNGVAEKVQWVADKFKWLDDVVVRHSYIPDMVESIGQHMARLDGLMVQPAGKAADKTAAAFRTLKDLMARLFPEVEERAAFTRDLALLRGELDAGRLSAEQYGEALARLGGGERSGGVLAFDLETDTVIPGMPKFEVPADMEPVGEASTFLTLLNEITPALQRIGDIAGGVFGGIADSISADVIPAIKVLGDKTATLGDKITALGQAAASIFGKIFGKKAGNIIGAVANAGAAIAAAFGKGPNLPAFANGGSFKVGGVPGIDKNIVSFRASRGEMVDIRKPGNDNGGGGRFLFDLRGAVMTQDLIDQMNSIGDGAAMRGALGGSSMAQASLARRGRRRLA